MKRIAMLCLFICASMSAGLAAAEEKNDYVEPKLSHASYGDLKIVVPVTSSDPKIWQFRMGNIYNALEQAKTFGGKLQITVVNYGGGVLMLKEKNNEIAQFMQELRERGVRFVACNQSLKHMGVDYHALNGVSEADIVPAGFLEVAWLQTQDYKLDPMN
jgi:intracellular sulfur oxidation DsrE/DsrF family protein